MLDLLIAAQEAAYTEGRQMMLNGVLDYQDRDLQRAFEMFDHSELLGDDFYWCFMGLAGLHGDRAVWRTLRDYGYSMESEISPPPDEDEPIGLSTKGTPLGCWLAQFAPPERLDFLQDEKLLDPWHRNYKSGKEYLCPAEMGLLAGSQEIFDYWMPLWEARERKEAKEHQRRVSASNTSTLKVLIPTVCKVILGMDQWSREDKPTNPFPSHWPNGLALEARRDRLMNAWADIHYPAKTPKQRLEAMAKNPPFSHEPGLLRGQVAAVTKWQLDQTPSPFDVPLELLALRSEKAERSCWLDALLKHGAPLSRPNNDDPFALAHALARLHALESKGEDYPLVETRSFVRRARVEDTTAFQAFLEHPILPKSGKGTPEPAIFMALEKKNWAAAYRLIRWGTPLELRNSKGLDLGSALLHTFVSQLDDPSVHVFTNLIQWLERASPEQQQALLNTDTLYPMPSPGRGKPRPEDSHLEFVLLAYGMHDELTNLIKKGLPIDRRNHDNMGLGWLLVASAAQRPLDEKLWATFQTHASAHANADMLLPFSYRSRTAADLTKEFQNNPNLAQTTLSARMLDSRWSSSFDEKSPKKRIRM